MWQIFTTVECRISSRLKWYKNRSRLAKVIVKNKMSRFLWFSVYNIFPNPLYRASAVLDFIWSSFLTYSFVQNDILHVSAKFHADILSKSSAVAEMSDLLTTIDICRKVEGCCAPFRGGELGPRITQCGLGRGLYPYQLTSWSIQPFGHNTPTLQTDTTDRQW